jgi:hypothetical protein
MLGAEVISMSKLGRNDPCHCGSGQKYKKCCSAQDAAKLNAELAAKAEERAKAAAEAAAQAEAEGVEVESKPDAQTKGAAKQGSAGGGRRPKQPAATPPPAFRRRAV